MNTNKITPDSLINLEPDNYSISLNITGYIGWGSNIQIDSNETEIINEILEEDVNYWWTGYKLFDLNIPDRHVFCIAVDNNNVKWMGIGSTGLVKFDDSIWTIINDITPGYSPGYVISIDVDAFNNIWMGTYSLWIVQI